MAKVSRLANISIDEIDGDHYKIDKVGLQVLLRAALAYSNFDDDYYIQTNKDVRDGIRKGEIKSGLDHFVEFGFFEGRRGWPIRVDEHFYLTENVDVKQSLNNRKFKNGQEHFDTKGEAEGRLPYRGFSYFSPIKKTTGLFRRKAPIFRLRSQSEPVGDEGCDGDRRP